MKFDVGDKNRCRLVCVKFHLNRCRFAAAVAKCLGGSLFSGHSVYQQDWLLQFLFVVKATDLNQQISTFYPHVISTVSQLPHLYQLVTGHKCKS